MPSEFMSCTVAPELEMKPGSIAGPGGGVAVTVVDVRTKRCNQLRVEVEILGSAYVFDKDKKQKGWTWPKYVVAGPKVLYMFFDVSPESPAQVVKRDYETRPLPIVRQGADASDAALKIGARIAGWGDEGKLNPVTAIGSVAILSGGLRKRMEAEGFAANFPNTAAGKEKLGVQALAFINKVMPGLQAEFPDLEWPTKGTIKNAILGDTASLQDTVDSLGPVIDKLAQEGRQSLLADFKADKVPGFKKKIKAFFANATEAAASLG